MCAGRFWCHLGHISMTVSIGIMCLKILAGFLAFRTQRFRCIHNIRSVLTGIAIQPLFSLIQFLSMYVCPQRFCDCKLPGDHLIPGIVCLQIAYVCMSQRIVRMSLNMSPHYNLSPVVKIYCRHHRVTSSSSC